MVITVITYAIFFVACFALVISIAAFYSCLVLSKELSDAIKLLDYYVAQVTHVGASADDPRK